jgi:MFS transporter, Spinster family, sphingosine-1-phosphate transporter
MSAHAITTPEHVPPPSAQRGAHLALTLLVIINLFNYIDRQVLAAVEPEIRKALFPESELPNASEETRANALQAMGWLSSAFLLTYMLTAPVFGFLAERMSRWLLIGVGVGVWSLASGASGWDWGPNLLLGYWLLFLTRCCVGVGEAAYGPAAPTVIADLYSMQSRGQVMSIFYLAIPVGGALGYTFGEVVSGSGLNGFLGREGWRWAFFLVVPPGILLTVLSLLMRDPRSKTAQADGTPLPRVHWRDYLILLRTPSYVLNTLGMAGMTFAIGGLAFWMPDYLINYRKVPDLLGQGPRTAFGAITVLAGFLATMAGGLAGDMLRSRFSGSYFLVSGAAMLLGFPMILLLIYTPFPLAWVFVFLAVFCLFFNTGPTNTILANVTHPSMRATAFAINIFIIHLLGDVPSPPLMGYITGYCNQDVSFIVVSLAMLVGGVFWLWGARYLERDTALAPLRLVPAGDLPPSPSETAIRAADERIQ